MTELLNTSGITYSTENIISTTTQKLVIISPYIQTSVLIREKITELNKQGVNITLIYEGGKQQPEEEDFFKSLTNIYIGSYQNFRARVFYNETIMVVSSTDFFPTSPLNREMGFLLKKSSKNNNLFLDVIKECNAIINASKKIFNNPSCKPSLIPNNLLTEIRNDFKKAVGGIYGCDICGAPYTAHTVWQKYCPDCRTKRKGKKKTIIANQEQEVENGVYKCLDCGTQYIGKTIWQKYCPVCSKRRKSTFLSAKGKD